MFRGICCIVMMNVNLLTCFVAVVCWYFTSYLYVTPSWCLSTSCWCVTMFWHVTSRACVRACVRVRVCVCVCVCVRAYITLHLTACDYFIMFIYRSFMRNTQYIAKLKHNISHTKHTELQKKKKELSKSTFANE